MPKRKTTRPEWQSAVIRIDDWDFSYNFGLNPLPKEADVYKETLHLKVTGKFFDTFSKKVKPGQAVEIRVFGKPGKEYAEVESAQAIGAVLQEDGRLLVICSIPSSSLDAVIETFNSGKMKIAEVVASELKYRQGLIRSIGFNTEFNPEDY